MATARTRGPTRWARSRTTRSTRSPEFQLVIGPRIEWNTFTRAPLENPDIERVFGARTGVTPGGFHVSPRIGFNWLYVGLRNAGSRGVSMSNLGTTYLP